MCGLVGIFGERGDPQEARSRIQRMMDVIAHRGPDGEGIFQNQGGTLGLGHRRLAIIDPNNGVQPMSTQDMGLTVVFNGAIYNYLELRRELIGKGHPLRTYSDTEVLLYAYREWGADCVPRLQGMFAFAIWDECTQTLFCARDRLGIKPFYYHWDGQRLLFASEIKAILASGLVAAERNADGLNDYLTFQYCLDEKTLFKNIVRLQPGHSFTAVLQGDRVDLSVKQYWNVAYTIDEVHDERWFIDQLAGLIDDAVRMHLRSDVPLGAHLSGGLDSSAVVCLAAHMLSGERIHTFTGAFREGPAFDETAHAKTVATFAGTQYNEIYIDGAAFADLLPRLIYHMDEPAAGPGLIPQYFVSKLAAEHVKVVLGGQGGDEIFIGYARYFVAYLEKCLSGAIFETAHEQPYAVTLESIVPNLPLLQSYKPMLQAQWGSGLFGAEDQRYFKLIDRSGGMTNLFSAEALQGCYSPFHAFQQIFNQDGLHSLINRMTHFDLKASLPALLQVEDRTSMAASIESRVPLLDHRIVEFMAAIPPTIKFSGGRMKHMFKAAVASTVPSSISERKDKMGFPTPLVQWTKGVAKEFVTDTLLSTRARQRGLYQIEAVERALDDEREFGRAVWGLLCIELWHRTFIDSDAVLND
jgi:asparagine synthase (glutamine-hydrolysing)